MLHQESLQPIIGVEHVDLLSALRKGFEARFEIKFQSAVLDPKLLKEADALAKEKYPRINA